MSNPAPRIASYILDDVVGDVTSFVNEQSANMIGVIGPAASLCMTMYVLFWGAAVASGRAGEPFSDGIKRIIRMCAVVIFGLTAGAYQENVSSFFLTAPSLVAQGVSGDISDGASGDCAAVGGSDGGEITMAVPIDRALCVGVRVGQKAWIAAKMADGVAEGIGYAVLAGIIFIAAGLVCAVAITTVFMAFICLAVLLALGPLFIFSLLFVQTKRFFELWLGQVLNFCLLFIIVACVMTLSFTMLNKYLDKIAEGDWMDLIINTIKVFVASLTVASILVQSRALASALAGGIAIQSQNIAGRLAGGAKQGASSLKKANARIDALDGGARAAANAVGKRVSAAAGMARRTFGR